MQPTCQHHPESAASARCVECGATLCGPCRVKVRGRNYCRPCVPPALQRELPGRRSPVAAAALSVVPGLGQMYAGSFLRGAALLATAGAIAANRGAVPDPIPLFAWVFGLFDAHALAVERNARVTGRELPRADRMQRRFWGWFAAAVAGFALLRGTVRPDLSPELLWPVALGLYGAFCLAHRTSDKVTTDDVRVA